MNKLIKVLFLLVLSLFLLTNTTFAQFELIWEVNRPGGLGNIHGITVNPENGELFISDFASVHRFDDALEERIEVINLNVGDIRGLGFDTRESLLILAGYGSRRYFIVDLDGEVLESIDVNHALNTVSYDSDQDLYIMGDWNQVVAFRNRQNEETDRFNVNVNITGVCYYPVNGTIFVCEGNDTVIEYSIDGEQIDRPLPNDVIGGNGQDIAYNPMSRIFYATGQGGWVGAWEDNYGAMPEPQFGPESFELAVNLGLDIEETLTITNVGEEDSRLRFTIDIVGDEENDWLTCDPVEGIIEHDEEAEITLTVSTEDLEPEQYFKTIIVNTNNPEFRGVEIPVELTVISGYGTLTGTVTDPATDQPVADAVISIPRFEFQETTNEEGVFLFEEVPEWIYTVELTADDYHPQTVEDVEVIEDEETVLNLELLHSECTPSEDEFIMALEPGSEHVFEFEIANGGNAPLTWEVERVLPEEVDLDPWELRNMVDAEEIVEDNQLNGVTYLNGYYYISGGNNRNDVNKIYVINTDGELVSDFDLFHESQYGLRDLTTDGELLWGSDDGVLYGFTTDGELIHSIDQPFGDNYRALTWNDDRGLFMISDITSDIFVIDIEGDLVERINRPDGNSRVYGMSYWMDDPDGYNLYTLTRGEEADLMVKKLNLNNGDYVTVTEIGVDGGRPGGIHISNRVDPYSWVMMALVQNTDRMAVWQLSTNRNWFRIEPESGEIADDESQEFQLTLDAEDIPADVTLEGELVFHHDGVGGETILPVRLEVVEGEVHTFRELELDIGWNLVSCNLQPDEEDVEVLMADLVEDGSLIMMKDGDGHFYRPEYNFNNIPGWFVDEGYQIKMRDAANLREAELRLVGWSVVRDEPIRLESGWQLVSYYPRFPIEATIALSGIEDHLIIAKDGFGNFYIPAWNFSNMGNMREGRGYFINVDENVVLVYMLEHEDTIPYNIIRQTSVYSRQGSLPVHLPTGSNMSLLALTDPMITGELGVYTSGRLIGSGIIRNGFCGIAVWGDDLTTSEIDGAIEEDHLEIKLLDKGALNSVSYTLLSGKNAYQKDGLAVIRLDMITEAPTEFGITSVYPNPFNSQTQLSYSLLEAGYVELNVYDMTGRLIEEMYKGHHRAGKHKMLMDGANLANGVYVICLETTGNVSQIKVTLVK
ncbi:MAG: carboxypeptidase regulatory-like domain-containing protein [Candidatus Hatepunaea meridiana]|nr:carboxypeptidase regulatory-like domain-containing protein [Candidatus Hatepunaea meridiana]